MTSGILICLYRYRTSSKLGSEEFQTFVPEMASPLEVSAKNISTTEFSLGDRVEKFRISELTAFLLEITFFENQQKIRGHPIAHG